MKSINNRFERTFFRSVSRRRYLLPLLIFGFDLAVYSLCFYLTLTISITSLRFLASLACGLAAGLLFVVGHDACHQSFTPSRLLNRILGQVAFLATYHPFSCWDLGHNRVHHRFTNLATEDYLSLIHISEPTRPY